ATAVGADPLTASTSGNLNVLQLTNGGTFSLDNAKNFTQINLAGGPNTVTFTHNTLGRGPTINGAGASSNTVMSSATLAGDAMTYIGSAGNDTFIGGAENDTVQVGAGALATDSLTAGTGTTRTLMITSPGGSINAPVSLATETGFTEIDFAHG